MPARKPPPALRALLRKARREKKTPPAFRSAVACNERSQRGCESELRTPRRPCQAFVFLPTMRVMSRSSGAKSRRERLNRFDAQASHQSRPPIRVRCEVCFFAETPNASQYSRPHAAQQKRRSPGFVPGENFDERFISQKPARCGRRFPDHAARRRTRSRSQRPPCGTVRRTRTRARPCPAARPAPSASRPPRVCG